jgi:hypothetical protein
MRRCRFKRGEDTVDLTAVQVSCHRMMDDILYNHEEKMLLVPITQTSIKINLLLMTLTMP